MGWEVAGKCPWPRSLHAEMYLNIEGRADFSPHLSGWKGIDEIPEARLQKYVWRQPCSPAPSFNPSPRNKPKSLKLGRTRVKSQCRHFGNWTPASPCQNSVAELIHKEMKG